ncbi:UDP-glucuronosyltransferase 2B31-like [Megalops cyprinoides]|uniref:UDP-glucuronosyltransferase 2B31-like n=1 Tax=Megalops cyprinoides TaxID=118141 RepID=UPI0018643A05|nr:UDP-glucuronosyltransferase 2B31-like [Megalops cyprinoides]
MWVYVPISSLNRNLSSCVQDHACACSFRPAHFVNLSTNMKQGDTDTHVTMKNVFSWRHFTIFGVALMVSMSYCDGGRILVFPVDGSHWVNMKVLIEGLHNRGHSVTVIRWKSSWYITEKSPFYTSITLQDMTGMEQDFFEKFLSEYLEVQRGKKSLMTLFTLKRNFLSMLFEAHRAVCKMVGHILENEELTKRLQDDQYDLLLTDPAVAGGVLLANYLKLPLVLNARWITSGEGHFAIAPSPLSYIPVPGSGFSDKMNFVERVKNIFYYAMILYQKKFVVGPHYEEMCEKYFGAPCDIETLIQAADIWLMRNDFVFDFPRPTMPNVVYMGGFQCKPSKPLPQDLEDFVQSSGEHGVIIMSLGTLVKYLPSDITDDIASVFAQLPQKVIWRHIGDRPSTLGNNTLIVNWMPQNDLLGHPKTRAFVAHGGTNGVQEAIYHGMPVLGIPLFFDQYDNLLRLKHRGAAKILDLGTFDRSVFLQAIQEVLHDPSYRMNMQMLSRLHQDQPMNPLDRAIFWIEYVMRHKGAAHLRTESYKMPWYSYHSVDVIAVLLAAVLLILFITVAGIKFLCFRVCFKRKMKHE